jgi:ApaG protein
MKASMPDSKDQPTPKGQPSRKARPLLTPTSEAITHDVRVDVESSYAQDLSQPFHDQWIFSYTIRITNLREETVQLLSRHWIITDATGHVDEVRGDGVVGEQPILASGESFQYSSWCPLKTPIGTMRGTYQMVSEGGRRFDVEIAPFGLKAPYTIH